MYVVCLMWVFICTYKLLYNKQLVSWIGSLCSPLLTRVRARRVFHLLLSCCLIIVYIYMYLSCITGVLCMYIYIYYYFYYIYNTLFFWLPFLVTLVAGIVAFFWRWNSYWSSPPFSEVRLFILCCAKQRTNASNATNKWAPCFINAFLYYLDVYALYTLFGFPFIHFYYIKSTTCVHLYIKWLMCGGDYFCKVDVVVHV